MEGNAFFDALRQIGLNIAPEIYNAFGNASMQQPVTTGAPGGGFGGAVGPQPEFGGPTRGWSGTAGSSPPFNPPAGVGASTITTRPGPSGGLYGPQFAYNPQQSAFGQVNPFAYANDRKTGAQQLAADVARAQFADYLSRFAPIEDFAVRSLRPDGTMDGEFDVARSRQAVLNAGANLQGQQERAMGRYGLAMTDRGIAGSNEVTGGVVSGMNQARVADADRRLQMLGGGGAAGPRG